MSLDSKFIRSIRNYVTFLAIFISCYKDNVNVNVVYCTECLIHAISVVNHLFFYANISTCTYECE